MGYAEDAYSQRLLVWRVTHLPVALLFAYWTAVMVFGETDWILLDNVNLLLHEAGHWFLSWGPEGLYFLGGTIGQLAWPIVFGIYFYRRGDMFAVFVCLWWLGENGHNIARYMADAGPEALPITNEIHDWAFLARKWGFLGSAKTIAGVIRTLGSLAMLVGTGYLLVVSWRPNPAALDQEAE